MSFHSNMSILRVALFACGLGFLGLIGSDLYLPAMPAMQPYFHTSIGNIELSVALYMLGFSISPLIYGPLSDSVGRKPIVIFGLCLASVAALLAALSHSIDWFLCMRAIQGIGCGATLSMFRVILRDVVQGKQMAKMASFTTMLFNLSPVIGMIAGGYLSHYLHWQSCFYMMVLLYVGFLILFAVYFPETLKQRSDFHPVVALQHYRQVISDRYLLGMATCSGLGFAIIFAFATTGAFIFQGGLHLSAIAFGWLGILLSLSSIVGKYINAHLVSRLNLRRVMLVGMACILIAGVELMLFASTLLTTIVGICMATISTGLIMSNAMSLGMQVYNQRIGYAASVYGSIQLMVVFLTNSLLAHFSHSGIVGLSLFYVAVGTLAIAVLYYTKRHQHEQRTAAITG